MHIPRKPGEQIEVDWAGDPTRLIDPDTGEITEVLWSSFFVTLVAKKYRLATMLPFVPRMVCDSR